MYCLLLRVRAYVSELQPAPHMNSCASSHQEDQSICLTNKEDRAAGSCSSLRKFSLYPVFYSCVVVTEDFEAELKRYMFKIDDTGSNS